MVVAVLKVFYKKQKQKIIQHRNYDNFNNDLLLNNKLMNVDLNNAELLEFTETFVSLLGKHAPKKTKNTYEQIILTFCKNIKEPRKYKT